jgi:hypothetical protein
LAGELVRATQWPLAYLCIGLRRAGDPTDRRIAPATDIALRHNSHLATAVDDRAKDLIANRAPIIEIGGADHRDTQRIRPTLHVHRADMVERRGAMGGRVLDVVIPGSELAGVSMCIFSLLSAGARAALAVTPAVEQPHQFIWPSQQNECRSRFRAA